MKISLGLFSTLVFVALTACSTGPAVKYNSPNDWVLQSKQGAQLPLGTKAGEWSEAKIMNTKGGQLSIRSKFLQQQATTCHYDVEFTNVGTTPVSGTAAISSPGKTAVYSHNSGRINLQPTKSVTYSNLESRECPLKWGTSTEMDHCASCKTEVLLAE